MLKKKIIIEVVKKGHNVVPFNIENFFDTCFVFEHLKIGVQRRGNENIIKKFPEQLDGIESYLYIEHNDYFVKVHNDFLKAIGLEVNEAWEIAEKNTFAETVIQSMYKTLCELMGEEYNELIENDDMPYVLSNKKRTKGASAILDKKALRDFAKRHGCKKIIAIPSSIHEFLIMPLSDSLTQEELNQMVKEANTTIVDPIEQLADKAYVIEII